MAKRVALIPGHGGFDPGAVNSTYGIRECDGTLAVALLLKELLEFNGYEVLISRTTDEACWGALTSAQDVANQIAWARQSGADIIVAIHFNSSTSKSAYGTEVLYTSNGFFEDEKVELAQCLLDELNALGFASRGLKETPTGVSLIRKVLSAPIVLTECCFISNDVECHWASVKYKQILIAKAHARAICRYFGEVYIDMEKINIVDKNDKLLTTGYLINGVSYIPVRAVSEALGAKVDWFGNLQPKVVKVTKEE